jgi:poly(A) polymerase
VALQLDGVELDFAMARRETYPMPGDNPLVEPGTWDSDLVRRDFTINAMA